jgi:hypothetical protein
MARRTPYTKVERKNFSRPAHVEGQGDVLYRGFQCLNPECTNFIFIKDEGITDDFEIVCDACGFKHTTGETTRVYDYDLRDKRDNSIIESGAFEVLHATWQPRPYPTSEISLATHNPQCHLAL